MEGKFCIHRNLRKTLYDTYMITVWQYYKHNFWKMSIYQINN